MERARFILTPIAGSLFLFAACDSKAPATPDAGQPVEDAYVAPPAPAIIEFTASPATVEQGQPTELHWRVENANNVVIYGANVQLLNTDQMEGTVMTHALHDEEVFVLRIAGQGPSLTTAVEIGVTWPEPIIERFLVEPDPPYVGSFPIIRWQTRIAERVTIFNGTTAIATGEGNQARRGSTFLQLMEETTTLTIKAENPTHTIMQDLVVTAIPPPAFTMFNVRPRTYIGTSTTVIVEWDSRGFDYTELTEDFSPVPGFPGTTSGSMTFEIQRPTNYQMTGWANMQPFGSQYRMVGPAAREFEPNDEMFSAQSLYFEGGVIGTISGANDVDFYYIDIYSMTGGLNEVKIWTRGEGNGCPTDTVLELYRAFSGDTEPLGIDEDDGIPIATGVGCSLITSENDEFARDLFGSYAIAVRGQRGATGPYVLFTEVNETPRRF